MTTHLLKQIILAAAALTALAPTTHAQSREWGEATDFYGRGVHAYFAGRSGEAEDNFSRSLGMDPSDPRPFYFRALCELQCGRTDEACSDMELGASLEAESPNRYAVGTALQRIQGCDRLVLEKYRQQARAGAVSGQRGVRPQTAQPYDPRYDDDSGALRQQVIVPFDEYLNPAEPRALSSEEVARRAAENARIMAPPAPSAIAPAPPVENPFGDDSANQPEAAPIPPQPGTTASPPAEIEEPAEAAPPAEATPPAESKTPPADENPPASDDDPFSGLN